ncbi:MAG TPA: hypothetical protein VJI68_00550 [Candidatus Nanoarchaeia archaeon]|nr:hypothetical protein [Candidatus Nanoarchaeia archaeon]
MEVELYRGPIPGAGFYYLYYFFHYIIEETRFEPKTTIDPTKNDLKCVWNLDGISLTYYACPNKDMRKSLNTITIEGNDETKVRNLETKIKKAEMSFVNPNAFEGNPLEVKN